MTTIRTTIAAAAIAVGLLGSATRADAALYNFSHIAGAAPELAPFLTVDVSPTMVGPLDAVAFTFFNSAFGPHGSSIVGIYFEEPATNPLTSGGAPDNDPPDVAFQNAFVGNLPNGGLVGFNATDRFITQGNTTDPGINQGEFLTIVYLLNPGQSLANLLGMRIGLDVDDDGAGPFAGPNSQFVTTIGVVPEPASLLLLGSGLAGVAAAARRRRRQVRENQA